MKNLILSASLLVVAAAFVARSATSAPTVVFTQKVLPEASGADRGALVVVQYMSDGSVRWTRAGR